MQSMHYFMSKNAGKSNDAQINPVIHAQPSGPRSQAMKTAIKASKKINTAPARGKTMGI